MCGAAIGTLAAVAFAPDAGIAIDEARAAQSKALKGLKAARCPAPYRVVAERSYDVRQFEEARDGLFHVLPSNPPVRVQSPVNWRMDPYKSSAFRGALQGLSWLDVLFQAYQEGDVGALRQARGLVLDWIRSNPRTSPSLPKKAWGDKVSGDRAPYIAYLTRAASCEGLLNRAQAKELLAALRTHARFLTDPKKYSPDNHGLFMDQALVLLERQLRFVPGARSWGKLGAKRFERTLRRSLIDREGFWLEHSSQYQLVIIKLVEDFLATSRRTGRVPRLFDRLTDVAGWLVMPDDQVPLLGDTNRLQVPVPVRDRAEGLDGMLFLPRSGLAVAKDQEAGGYLSTAATFFSSVHKHSDELTFDLFDRGRRIVSDTGNFSNDPGVWRRFGRLARAHSVLTVDGKNFPRRSGEAYGSGLRAAGEGAGWYAVQGVNPLLRDQGVRHRRVLLYKPGFALVVVDRVRSSRPHVYRRHFQLGAQIAAVKEDGAVGLSAPGFSSELRSRATAPEVITLAQGQIDPIAGFI
ncbi:MAG: heparinase II/III domain-containing protein, partial [Solirubrobacterales bacterium]